jgi:multidrug efflux pump
MHAFDRLAHRYASALDWVMERPADLAGLCRSLAVTALLFVVIPKNLFPTQDTGQIAATIIAANDTGFARMSRLQNEVADALLKDPAVESLSSSVGVDGINPMLSQGAC